MRPALKPALRLSLRPVLSLNQRVQPHSIIDLAPLLGPASRSSNPTSPLGSVVSSSKTHLRSQITEISDLHPWGWIYPSPLPPFHWTPLQALWQRSRENDVKNTYPSHLPSRSLQKVCNPSQVLQNQGGWENLWRCRLQGFQGKFQYPTQFSPWILPGFDVSN